MSSVQKAESGEGPGRAPPTQRPRQANGRAGAGEGVRSGWRPCQQQSQAAEAADEIQNHRHGNQQHYRRNESSSGRGGRTRAPRGPVQEGGAPQQPRPGVTRYRRAQQPRHKHGEQGDAQPHPTGGGKSGPTLGKEDWAGLGAGTEAGAEAGVRLGGDTGAHSLNAPQFDREPGRHTPSFHAPHPMPAPVPPPHSPDHNHAALNPKLTKSRRTHHQQPRQQRTEPATDPNAAEPNVEPTTAPHVKPNIEPCAESSKEPSTESYSCTERNTEPHKESHTEPDTGSCTESYRDPHLESHTDAHGQLGQGYEEIEGEWEGEWVRQTALQLRRAGLRLFEQGGLWQRRTVGSRLHHYDGRSDGESDSPEKEPEVLLSPGQKDGEKVEAAYVRRRRSWSLDRALGEVGDWPESEQDSQREQGQDEAQEEDIKEAIQEVKTRTIRSPYTPEEPLEPVWVMRQDLSPTTESDLQPSLGSVSSLDSDSTSPLGPESTNRQQLQETNYSVESPPSQEPRKTLASFPTYVDVPGPCDPEDLIDGIIFAANYLGSTQLLSEKTPSKSVRMTQAQEAVSRVRMAKSRKKSPQSPEAQPPVSAEVDLFISTQRIKVLNADTQETMMDHPLRTISYIADIGDIVVLMARRKRPRPRSQELPEAEGRGQGSDSAPEGRRQYRMICHVFESEDAQLIAQSIGQAFSVAYQEFLRANGINPEDLSQREYSDLLSTQDMYNDDLIHFSKSENCKNVVIEKQKGEILGVVVVESGWGSILPTVIIANMMHGGPAERSGGLSVGDQVMSINNTSLVGLPLTTCQSIIKGLKSQPRLKLNIVRCPPVTMVLIRRPDLRYQLGFSVQNGIICSLMRGGIAERGVRVGHRIIEISGQSVVATPHERIVNILSSAVGEIHMKTMPAAMYRLLTGQEQPVYI
ncbi:hypothetical protein COCON_G00164560 [Conger conger]|uniref:Amyloid beta precursor protein binding family A member 1 n=1 Tax=Conger conger TaxID=82655 RepID=A0A9Q1HTU7_CONCO|nr:hypothetical protein COCON_G00164560 [Conger conger]